MPRVVLSYVNVSDRRHPTTSRCHSYGLSLASVPFHTPDRQHGTLCRTAFAMHQTLQSFGNILKLTFSVQHLMFVNFYSLILLSVDSVMHLCHFCNRRIINVQVRSHDVESQNVTTGFICSMKGMICLSTKHDGSTMEHGFSPNPFHWACPFKGCYYGRTNFS